MADVELTAGDDVYTHPTGQAWTNIYGRAGSDRITLASGANVVGGAGDDVITNLGPAGVNDAGVGYWDSGPIMLDLEAGYCLDGWGGRDTVVNFVHAHTSGRDGDVVLGSRYGDDIFVNGFNWTNRSPGQATLDLRGGNDLVTILNVTPQQATIVASSDGRVITVSANNYTATLRNLETLRLVEVPGNDWSRAINHDFRMADLIDFSRVGPDTLLTAGQAGWAGGSITYSFMAAAPAYGGGEGGTGFVAPPVAYQAAVRAVFAKLGAQLNVSFTEVPDSAAAYGQLRFGANQQAATKGYSFIPGTVGDNRAGDVWLDVETLALLQPGQEGWQVLLHEIGHALGLSHPIAEGTDTTATVLLNAWNHNGYTVMSPNTVLSGLWQSWFGPLDLQALQHLHGARAVTVNTGSDWHRLTDAQGASLTSLRDSGGFDILDGSALSVGVYLDLRPGSLNSVGLTARGTASIDNLFIENGTLIEAAIGTPFDDVLIGNDAVNYFLPASGNDRVEGLGGADIVLLGMARAGYRLERLTDGSAAWVLADVAGSDGADTLVGVERLWFTDVRLALDIEGLAGEAARIVATVYGAGALADPALIGGVLQGLDAGVGVRDVYAGALGSARFQGLAGGVDHLSFVKQMFRNLLNAEVGDAVAQPFVDGYLASGAYTQAAFAQFVSVLAPVDMVGLAGSGLAYL